MEIQIFDSKKGAWSTLTICNSIRIVTHSDEDDVYYTLSMEGDNGLSLNKISMRLTDSIKIIPIATNAINIE